MVPWSLWARAALRRNMAQSIRFLLGINVGLSVLLTGETAAARMWGRQKFKKIFEYAQLFDLSRKAVAESSRCCVLTISRTDA
jgi:hypothetical protein